jgi:ABC-type branched-subunit amino acid transport system permease subunit
MAPEQPENPPIPSAPEAADQPQIGVDSWVATADERTVRRAGPLGFVAERLDALPRPTLFVAFVVAAALLPFLTSNAYIIRVGFDTLLYMLLALGLNVVLGYAGLLDLGYVAFYGIGAYGYAMLASSKFGIHFTTALVIPIVVVGCVLVGFLVGLPSRRLIGDYLAIVTLFFGQLFVTVYNNGNRISILGLTRGYDMTNGPDGIANIDPFHFFGYRLHTVTEYFYAALIVFALVLTVMYLVNESRTGRAWRSLREDPFAAELVGMPVNKLKLFAFAFGAGVAGLTGTLFAALNTGVFTKDFDAPLLITVYAMLILGGTGSLGGVIVGAIVVNVALEILRTPDKATWVVYVLLFATVVLKLKPARWAAAVVAGTIAFGFAAHAIAHAVDASWTAGSVPGTGALGDHISSWVIIPLHQGNAGNVAVVLLIVMLTALTTLRDPFQKLLLIPTLYLFAFTWENRLVEEPSVSRLILLGAILIVLMNTRPQGLLGTSRVEIA